MAAYDKRQRKKVMEKWCRRVEHLARRPIRFDENIPSVGIWISAPPGDQLKWNKEVWRDFVKVHEAGDKALMIADCCCCGV